MNRLLSYCGSLPNVRFDVGEVILSEGSKTGIIYILKEGEAEVIKRDIHVSRIDEPGSIIGELSVLLDIPHMATVRAVKPTQLYKVEDPTSFLQSHTEICYHLAHLLAQRLHSVSNYLVDVKEQYKDSDDHFGMIDEILETLVHQQGDEPTPGSDRDPV